VRLSDRVKPTQPTAAIQGRAVTATNVMEVEQRSVPLRREQEALLVQLVKETPDSDPDKADLMFRLAEHYAKQQRFWRIKALEPVVPATTRQR